MKIIRATKAHCKEISRLMKKDLDAPPKEFSQEFLVKFKEHAEERNILKEFENPLTIGFIAKINEKIVGFIVGYVVNSEHAAIHYINGENKEIKKSLLQAFIISCKNKNMRYILTDSFEFMENDSILKEKGFNLDNKEKVNENLIMLWRKLDLD